MKNIKKLLSLILAICACFSIGLGINAMSKNAKAASSSFSDTFDYIGYQSDTLNRYLWSSGDVTRPTGPAPTISGGVVKFSTKQNLQFNWQTLATYSSTTTYTFEFDFKVTNSGNGTTWSDAACTRALYVAFGGYYNQIEIPTSDGRIRAGDTYQTVAESVYLNVNLHAKLELLGTKCTTTITNGTTTVITGSRTNTVYASTTDQYMPYLGIRCEDGAVDIDNFSFTNGSVKYVEDFSNVPTQGDITSISLWTKGDYKRPNGAAPSIDGGVAKFTTQQCMELNWKKLTDYATTKTYTFEFDFKVTNAGNGANWSSEDCTRALFVAFGGWYNQIEIPVKDGRIRAGDTYQTAAESVYLNVNLHAKLVLSGTTITTTITNGTTTVITGSRTNSLYASTTDEYMPYFSLRCEDGAVQIDNFKFNDGTYTYSEAFNSSTNAGDYMCNNSAWLKGDHERQDGTTPRVENGVLTLSTKQSVEFSWKSVTTYDASKTYTFEFDFKVTNAGSGNLWGNDACSRALYVAFGGYYNQIELPVSDGRIRAGDTYQTVAESVYLNKNLHAQIILEGNIVTTAIFDANNNVIISGSRTGSQYSSTTDQYMPYFALRCEDGSVQIDNFAFSADTPKKIGSTALSIPSGKCANYSATVAYNGTDKVALKLNSTELFAISPAGGLIVGGSKVLGTYNSGSYKLNIMVNTAQKMVLVEITLPNGGILRRGSYNLIPSGSTYSIDAYSSVDGVVKNATVSYASITSNTYQINETEPTLTGVNANIYNIVTSFNDATTTRNFAFTAKTAFVNGGAMAIKYRVKGTTTWSVVNAVKETESINTTEDYYKADVTGLKANTEYEYKIGLKDSTDETNKWTKAYTFKTATGKEQDFTFFAVGDTQGVTWNGKVEATKGFMYAQAAIQEAMEETVNPAFMLHTGDYIEGERSDIADQWNLYFKALGEYGTKIPMFGTIGNHDTYQINTTTGDNYFDLHFNHPNNGGISALDTTYTNQLTNTALKALIKRLDESIYSYNYGDAHIVVLASGNYSSDDRLLLEAQRKWLEADLTANKCARWKIIMVHEPVYHRIGGSESRPWLYDVIENHGVDLLIQGHSHVVTRTYPIKGGKIVSKTVGNKITKGSGTVYTTIGSTAYNHDGLGNPNLEEMMVIATSHSEQPTYATINVTNNKLTMTVKQLNGYVLDKFEIVASSTDTTNHTGTLTLQGKKNATCTTAGYTGDMICSVCGRAAQYGTTIAATGHSFTKQTVDSTYLKSSATCKSAAVYYKCCATCGLSSKGQTGEATFTSGSVASHAFTKQTVDSTYLKSSATCKSAAVYYKCCATCGLSSKGQTGEATFTSGSVASHDFTKQTATADYLMSQANCTQKAYYYKSCTMCGLSSKGQTGEATFTSGSTLGHNFSTTLSYDETEHWYYCTRCSTRNDINSHSYTSSVVTNATCLTKGTTKYTCDCGYNYTKQDIQTNPNNHENKTPINAGTENAHTKYACCGEIASTTHTLGKVENNGENHKQTCDCGYVKFTDHVFDQKGEVEATSATCTSNQTNYYECECSAQGTSTYEVENTKIAHDFTKQEPADIYLKRGASCTQKAVYYTCCSYCGLSSHNTSFESTFESGNLADHTYGEWIPEIPAQVGINGTLGHYNCSDCGKDFDESHNELADLTIPALNPPTSSSSSSSSEEDSSESPSISSSSEENSESSSEEVSITSSEENSESSSEVTSSSNIEADTSSSVLDSTQTNRSGCGGNINGNNPLFVMILLAIGFILLKVKRNKNN